MTTTAAAEPQSGESGDLRHDGGISPEVDGGEEPEEGLVSNRSSLFAFFFFFLSLTAPSVQERAPPMVALTPYYHRSLLPAAIRLKTALS